MPDDYDGSTFTVSNLGAYGVDHFTAIINSPDSAILAVGMIQDRPVVEEGEVVVRPMVKLTLSSDHRVIDGAVAVGNPHGCAVRVAAVAGARCHGRKEVGQEAPAAPAGGASNR